MAELIQLVSKGDLRPSKLELIDKIIVALINSMSSQDAQAIAILLNGLISLLAGGTKEESALNKLERLRERGKALLSAIDKKKGLRYEEIFDLFSEIMEYLNSEHRYLFKMRPEIADRRVVKSLISGGADDEGEG